MEAQRKARLGGHRAERGLLSSLLLGCGLTLLFSVLLLLLLTLFAYRSSDPTALLRPLSYGALVVCSLAAGICCARLYRRRAPLCGLLGGILFLAVLWGAGLCLPGESDLSPAAQAAAAGCVLLLAELGALLTARKPRRRRRRH